MFNVCDAVTRHLVFRASFQVDPSTVPEVAGPATDCKKDDAKNILTFFLPVKPLIDIKAAKFLQKFSATENRTCHLFH